MDTSKAAAVVGGYEEGIMEAKTIVTDQSTWPEAALACLREWDREAGITPEAREASGVDYADAAGDACNPGWDPEEWLNAIARGDVAAILQGRRAWGLAPLI